MTMPDQDKATYLRVNLVSSGHAPGKEVAKNVQQLLLKYGDESTWIKV
jgi:hypothetical protein